MFSARGRKARTIVEQEVLPHLDALFGYALYLTRSRTEAEELTQDTLVKAVTSISQYQTDTNCKAWLFRIMHNTFLNNLRRKPMHVELDDSYLNEVWEKADERTSSRYPPNPEESFVSLLSCSKVREAVEKLPREFRSVVVLADLEGFSYREIADILSCPIGTVMSRLHRGRKLLKNALFSWATEMGLVSDPNSTAQREASAPTAPKAKDNVRHICAFRRPQQRWNGRGKEEPC